MSKGSTSDSLPPILPAINAPAVLAGLSSLSRSPRPFHIELFSASDPVDSTDMDDFSASNNLLSVFLEYCSIIQQFSKSNEPSQRSLVHPFARLDEEMCNTTKLCYLILLCIAEDEFANATMHDENVIFSVYLHRAVRGGCSYCSSPWIFSSSRCDIASRTTRRILLLVR